MFLSTASVVSTHSIMPRTLRDPGRGELGLRDQVEVNERIRRFRDVDFSGMSGFYERLRTVVALRVGSYGVPIRQMGAAMWVAWCLGGERGRNLSSSGRAAFG